jgi:predicted tellurium resistance membrane protein TerC
MPAEAADLVFALDAAPAVLAVTRDPFIVFASNILVILVILAILVFIGARMLLPDVLGPMLAAAIAANPPTSRTAPPRR